MLRCLFIFSFFVSARAETLKCLQESCSAMYKACEIAPECKSEVIDCMAKCKDDSCETKCVEDAVAKKWEVGPSLIALTSLNVCGGFNQCFKYDAEMVALKASTEPAVSAGPCCKTCTAPLIKMYSVDRAHGFCGDACMDPKKFDLYKKFEPNLTVVDADHPDCSRQYSPVGTFYTDYDSTVTHGDPFGILSVTLDLYAPAGMPDHSCCSTPLPGRINCFGKPKDMSIKGTGPYCCPSSATEEEPCPKEAVASVNDDAGMIALKSSGETSKCLQESCSAMYKACEIAPECKSEVIDCMAKCQDDSCETKCVEDAVAKKWEVGPSLIALTSLNVCGGFNQCFKYDAEMVALKASTEPAVSAGPCCKTCTAPLIKMYSVDRAHGFCGDACMDPKKFDLYKKFEPNLTVVDADHPDCSRQYSPVGTFYTDYDSTVTHGDPFGILSVTLDLYAPAGMPDHSCCSTPLPGRINCFGKPKNMSIKGTGPYCCPSSATEEEPCPKEAVATVIV